MKLRYLILAFLVLAFASVFIGVHDVTPLDLFRLTDDQVQVLLISRFPRLISIIIAGASMSICGLIMQQLTRNRFVSPTTAGTMDAARLGVLIAIMVFGAAGFWTKMLAAFSFALAGTLVFMKILDKIRFKDPIFIPLVGLMFGGILNSVTTFFAYKYNLIQSISSWMQGDFSLIMSGRYEMLYLSVPLVVLAYIYANRFTIAGMGEDFAANLGVHYRRTVNVGLVIVALVSSVVILTVGTIPFLGLVVPNLVSMYMGDHLKKSLAHTATLGAIFVLFFDILGRVIIYPYEISVGLTVGVIGSALFLYLLLRRRAYES